MIYYSDKSKDEILEEIESEIDAMIHNIKFGDACDVLDNLQYALKRIFRKMFEHFQPETNIDDIILKNK